MEELANYWWIFKALGHMALVIAIGKVVIYCYREHSYLYNLKEHDKSLERYVEMMKPIASRVKSERYDAFLTDHLSRSGINPKWDANYFKSSQLLFGLASGIFTYIMFNVIAGFGPTFSLLGMLLGVAYPLIKLIDRSQSRFKSCQSDLPFYIDYLALCMDAGLDFNEGLSRVVDDAPESPLKEEFSQVVQDLKLGRSREQSLTAMQNRLHAPAMTHFVQTLVQAMRLGSDVSKTLLVMSETLQSKRFQVAEESAGKISVRMMIPMMLFVMPATVMVLLGPILLEWLIKTS